MQVSAHERADSRGRRRKGDVMVTSCSSSLTCHGLKLGTDTFVIMQHNYLCSDSLWGCNVAPLEFWLVSWHPQHKVQTHMCFQYKHNISRTWNSPDSIFNSILLFKISVVCFVLVSCPGHLQKWQLWAWDCDIHECKTFSMLLWISCSFYWLYKGTFFSFLSYPFKLTVTRMLVLIQFRSY